MAETAGRPQAFGPGGPPKAFGPPGGSSTAGAGGASPSKSSATGSSTTGTTGGARTGSATAGGSSSTKASGSSGTSSTPKASSADLPQGDVKLPVAAGSIVRIEGLKAQPTLNGELGQILHAADSSAERLVVRTRVGDKSLKPANLLVGRSVLPKGTVQVWIGITGLSGLAVASVLASGGRSAYSAAAAPAISALWVFMTCLLSLYLNWPVREPGMWLQSVSEMSTNPPSREFFRLGFLSASAFLAVTVWLYGQLVVVQLADTPPPSPFAAGVNATTLNSSVNDSVLITDSNATLVTESNDSSAAETAADGEAMPDTVVDVANKSVLENETIITVNKTIMWETAPARSIRWGYVLAVGLAVQAIFVYDGRLSWRSMLNFAGWAAFGVGLFQHVTLTSLIISSPRGKPFLEASSILASVVKGRRYITDYVPLLLLAAPLSSQLFNSSKMRQSHHQPTFKSIFKDSGMLSSARMLQWMAVCIFVLFYSSFSCDLWVAGHLLASS